MEIKDLKFKEADFVNKDISSLPNQVVGEPEFLKNRLDYVAKNMIALGRFNELIDLLGAAGNGVVAGDAQRAADSQRLGGKAPEAFLLAGEPYFEAIRTTAYTITGNGTGQVFQWNSGTAVRGFDGMTNYKVTIKQSGLYHIEISVNGISGVTAPFTFGITCQGSYISGALAQQVVVPDPTSSNAWQPVHCSTEARFAAGDTVWGIHYGVIGKTIVVSQSGYFSRFTVRRVGSV